jgi:hypothetical protein
MQQNPTIIIPLATAEKLAAIARAMLSLAEEMKRHAQMNTPDKPVFPIPDLTPPKDIPEDQAWFWSEDWQVGERAVNEDIKAGRIYGGFSTTAEMLTDVDRRV